MDNTDSTDLYWFQGRRRRQPKRPVDDILERQGLPIDAWEKEPPRR